MMANACFLFSLIAFTVILLVFSTYDILRLNSTTIFTQDSFIPVIEKQWIGTDNIKAWSAFYDERNITGRPYIPHVVVIGLYKGAKPSTVCKIWTSNSHFNYVESSISYFIRKLFVVHCPCRKKKKPIFVSLKGNDSWKIEVEEPVRPGTKKNLAICLKEVYDIPNVTVDPIKANYIVEWIELNRILGVDQIIVYNVSMNRNVSSVFNYYAKQGFVTIHKRPQTNIDVPKPSRKIGLNDCMFRYMYAYKKFIDIDTDEFINGYKQETLWEMLSNIASERRVSMKKSVFQFLNQRYFLDDVNVKPGPLFTQYAVHHIDPEKGYSRSKQIVDSRNCYAVTVHTCARYENVKNIYVKPTSAVLYHYKSCEFSRQQNKPSNCSHEFQTSQKDLTMTKYGKELTRKNKKALKELDL